VIVSISTDTLAHLWP